MLNQKLDPTGLANPAETHGLTGTGPGVDCQNAAGQVFGRFWKPNKTVFLVQTWTAGGLLGPIANTTAKDSHTPRPRRSAQRLHCWAMGTQHSGLPSDEPTKQSLLPVSDMWRVGIYPVWDEEDVHEDVLWQRAERRKHSAAFPNSRSRDGIK